MERKGEKHRKYTIEEKVEILEDRKKNQLSRQELIEKYEIRGSTLRDWIRAYEDRGAAGLSKPKGTKVQYTPEYRMSVIRAMMGNEWSYTQTAKEYGINRSVIQLWMRTYQQQGEAGLQMQHKRESKLDNPNLGRKRTKSIKARKKAPQDRELLDELHHLRMENEYLKKLNALARKKELLGKKKKPR